MIYNEEIITDSKFRIFAVVQKQCEKFEKKIIIFKNARDISDSKGKNVL